MDKVEQNRKPVEAPKKIGRFGRLMLVVGLALSGCADNDRPPVEPTAQVRASTGTYTETFLPVIASAEEEIAATLPATATNEPTNTPEPTATSTLEPTPTNTLEPTATNTPVPRATEPPQPTATETEVPKSVVLFDGDPRNATTKEAIGDKGFQSDCNFGDQECPAWKRIVWGPFIRAFDQEDIIDGAIFEITFWGEGDVKAGATDSFYFKEADDAGKKDVMFGYGGTQANLSRGPVTLRFTSKELGMDSKNPPGWGVETTLQQMPTKIDENGNAIEGTEAEKGRITRIKVEMFAPPSQ